MECPHCKKEVFGRGHNNVDDLYEEPEPLTEKAQLEQLQAENEALKEQIERMRGYGL